MSRTRKPASVNVDFVVQGAVAGRGGVIFVAIRNGAAERRTIKRLAEALQGAPVALRAKGRTNLRAGYHLAPAGFDAGWILWTGEIGQLPDAAADLGALFDAAERLGPGELARITIHVRPDGEPLAAQEAA